MINPSEMANIARSEELMWWFRGMRAISFSLLDPIMAGGRVRKVLEAGCGIGYFASRFQQRYGSDVFVIDLDSDAMRYCRERHAPHPAQASVVSLPFPDRSFDLVASMDVLPHFPRGEEDAPFAEMLRVLRPNGYLFLRAAAFDVFRSRHSAFVWERQRFTRPRLRALAEKHGLRILRLTYANFLLTPAAFLKFRVWEPLTRQPPASAVKLMSPWLERLLYVPLAMEKSWLSRGINFPWGQSLILLAQKENR